MKLSSGRVSRAGKTARSWSYENNAVELNTEANCISFKISLSSKGGGTTEVKIDIGSKDFAALASAVVKVDREVALREMAAVLAAELARQSAYDKVIAREARDSVTQEAEKAYRQAPAGRNHAERLNLDMVRQMVEALNEADKNQEDEDTEAA